MANLDILENEGLMTRGQELEGALFDALNAHAGHPAVDHVRGGTGMMAALEIAPDVMESNPKAALELVASVRAAGVVVRPIVSCIVCSPPLTSTQEHLDLLSEAVGAGLDALVGAARA